MKSNATDSECSELSTGIRSANIPNTVIYVCPSFWIFGLKLATTNRPMKTIPSKLLRIVHSKVRFRQPLIDIRTAIRCACWLFKFFWLCIARSLSLRNTNTITFGVNGLPRVSISNLVVDMNSTIAIYQCITSPALSVAVSTSLSVLMCLSSTTHLHVVRFVPNENTITSD